MATAFGVAMAAPVAVFIGPAPAAVGFVVGGAIFGILVGLNSRHVLVPLTGLSPADRATVLCTVQRGLAPADRRLAAAVVGYVEATRRRAPAWLANDGGARLFYLLAGLQLLQAVLKVLDRNWPGVALSVTVGMMWFLVPRLNVRTAERRDQAERLARALLDGP